MQDLQEEYKKRRAERRRRIRNRRIFICTIVFLILALVTFIVLSFTVLFPVRKIVATGSRMYTSEQIVKECGITTQDNIFTFSAGKAKDKLQKNLPFLEDIEIKRQFPETVNIVVTDAKEFVCYPINGKYYTVSRKGRVLNEYGVQPDDLLLIRCGEVICEKGAMLEFSDDRTQSTVNLMIENFEAYGIVVNDMDLSDPLSINARVDGRFTVDFGTSGSIEKKIAHLAGMIKSIAPERSGRINLSMWSVEKNEGTFIESHVD